MKIVLKEYIYIQKHTETQKLAQVVNPHFWATFLLTFKSGLPILCQVSKVHISMQSVLKLPRYAPKGMQTRR